MNPQEKPPVSQLIGNLQISGFQFDYPETLYFTKHVWSRWSAAQQKVNTPIRMGMTDLAMISNARLDYELVSAERLTECFYLSTRGSQDRFLQLALTQETRLSASWPGMEQPLQATAWPAFEAWVKRNEGQHYGQSEKVQFEAVAFKLRQILSGVKAQVIGSGVVSEGGMELWLQLSDSSDRRWQCLIKAYHCPQQTTEKEPAQLEISEASSPPEPQPEAPSAPPVRYLALDAIAGYLSRPLSDGSFALYALNGKGVAVRVEKEVNADNTLSYRLVGEPLREADLREQIARDQASNPEE